MRTPLWTKHPEKTKQYGYETSDSVAASDVAEAMLLLVQDERYAGGTVLEITAMGTRVIPEWNISPPASMLVDVVSQEAIDRNLAERRWPRGGRLRIDVAR